MEHRGMSLKMRYDCFENIKEDFKIGDIVNDHWGQQYLLIDKLEIDDSASFIWQKLNKAKSSDTAKVKAKRKAARRSKVINRKK